MSSLIRISWGHFSSHSPHPVQALAWSSDTMPDILCGTDVARDYENPISEKTRPENIPSDLVFYWWAQQDSNLRHADYESDISVFFLIYPFIACYCL